MASHFEIFGDPIVASAMSGLPFDFDQDDRTPQALAVLLLFAGGVIYLLNRAGFRFNFGVAAGR